MVLEILRTALCSISLWTFLYFDKVNFYWAINLTYNRLYINDNYDLARLSPHFRDVSIKFMTLSVRYFVRNCSFVCILYRYELFRRMNDAFSKTLASCTTRFEQNYIAISICSFVWSDNTAYPRETVSSYARRFDREYTLSCIGFLASGEITSSLQGIPSEIMPSYAWICESDCILVCFMFLVESYPRRNVSPPHSPVQFDCIMPCAKLYPRVYDVSSGTVPSCAWYYMIWARSSALNEALFR
jgi:hypothetical protein